MQGHVAPGHVPSQFCRKKKESWKRRRGRPHFLNVAGSVAEDQGTGLSASGRREDCQFIERAKKMIVAGSRSQPCTGGLGGRPGEVAGRGLAAETRLAVLLQESNGMDGRATNRPCGFRSRVGFEGLCKSCSEKTQVFLPSCHPYQVKEAKNGEETPEEFVKFDTRSGASEPEFTGIRRLRSNRCNPLSN